MIIPNIWKNKSHVPNHQPDILPNPFTSSSGIIQQSHAKLAPSASFSVARFFSGEG
jgi:hypothetical protein